MARIPEEEVNAVRAKADIVDVISKYLQVQKKGKDYKAVCPFHDDHDPSMTISPDKQIYKCFVCGAGGNVFTFVQNYENVSFPEAVEHVASLIGYRLSVSGTHEEKPKDAHRENLYRILNETIRYTMYQMNTSEAQMEKVYLEKRGLNEDIREKFQIGFNPAGDVLLQFLKAKGYEERDMAACNVIRTGATGVHDVFSGRITFPIHDISGNPIGFSARTLDRDNPSKYINTNDTELFKKSDLVYNAHRARTSARREGKIFVCEGVTDVIAFARAGIENAVCTLGTSCTDHQIGILKNLAVKIVFCYDGDDAGQAATYRAAKMARKAGCTVSVIDNKTGLDPDEIIRERGAGALKELASQEISWMEFVLNYLQKHTNFQNYLEKKEFVQKAQAEINELEDEFDRKYFTEELSRISGFHLEYQPKTTVFRRDKLAAVKIPSGSVQAEEQILAMMLASKSAAARFEERIGFLMDPSRNELAMLMIDAYRTRDRIDPSAFIDEVEDQNQKNLISKLTGSFAYRSYDSSLLDGAIRKVLITVKTNQADAFKEQLSHPMNQASREALLNEYQECLKELRGYIDEDSKE
ncbi:MAG: DNA primase [Solobacterium sp.]|nr:DNA primase [Solobacterium sp.]